MNKELLLRQLAENGYNVYYGAKKHFATYDIVEKAPGRIAIITLLIGILSLYEPNFLYNKEVSVALIFASVIALTISLYNGEKETYKDIGTQLTQLHNELRTIYYRVQGSNQEQFHQEVEEMNQILNRYYDLSISKQIFLSDWYAHYKLFFQSQYEWLDEQKNFTWRDKVPMSFRIVVVFVLLAVVLVFLF
ncbi:hypothetical protein CJ195_18360 [Bacillus sp. UMB0899]|nr:hypothetical protein CJ195_18360 [Bacillus sp. UMB0899]